MATTAEEFIRKNPFPKNGSLINEKLVNDIQDPSKKHLKRKNLEELFKVNARLIYIIYKQYNYGQTLASIMSFVWEGMQHAVDIYDPKTKVPFYNFATATIRGQLQNYYNYNESLIHVPVTKRKNTIIEYENADYHVESESVEFAESDDNDLSFELNELIKEYKWHNQLTNQDKKELEVFIAYRNSTLNDVAEKYGYNSPASVKLVIAKVTRKLIELRKKLG